MYLKQFLSCSNLRTNSPFYIIPNIFIRDVLLHAYNHTHTYLSNKRAGWNKQVWWAKLKSISYAARLSDT